MNTRSFFFLLLMLPAMMTQAQRVTKKIVLNKGQKLETVVNTTMTMSQEMMGQQMEFKSDGTNTSVLEVKNVTDKSYVIANTLKRMVFHTSAMGQEINFDSDKKEDMEGEMGMAMKDKISMSKDMVVDKQGRITEMNDTSSTADMMTGLMGENFGVGTQLSILTLLPEKSVKTGDSWTDSVGTAETMKSVNTYTLRKVSGNEATIDITGTFAKKGMMERQGMQVTMNLSGTSKAEAVYELNTGILKNNSTTGKFTGTMELMGQSMPISANIVSTTRVNKL